MSRHVDPPVSSEEARANWGLGCGQSPGLMRPTRAHCLVPVVGPLAGDSQSPKKKGGPHRRPGRFERHAHSRKRRGRRSRHASAKQRYRLAVARSGPRSVSDPAGISYQRRRQKAMDPPALCRDWQLSALVCTCSLTAMAGRRFLIEAEIH